jgi:hypothetical protein
MLNRVKSDGEWSDRQVQGFTLAATVHHDPRARQAVAGLAPVIVDDITAPADELTVCSAAKRRERVRSITAQLPPALGEQAVLEPRAQALLAPSVPKRIGRNWLKNAPSPRPGFRPEPGLLALLRRIASDRIGKTPSR